jgi:hypothetical protein
MKTDKKFDCVKMMRDIRNKVSADIKDMSSDQILDYIKCGRNDYEKLMASHRQELIHNTEIKL